MKIKRYQPDFIFEFDTLDELKADIKAKALERKQRTADEQAENDIVDVITLLSNIEKHCNNQMNIPQMKPAPKATEQELNKRLFDAIKSKDSSIVFSVPFFSHIR